MITVNRNSVRATTSPTSGGTQSDELQAKIKSVTSSITVSAVFLYDTRSMDSDGGAWRKKCAGLSWFDEAASATRSSRSEFPSVALIVSDSASGVTIYDLDDVNAPAWMVFNGLSSDYATKMLWASGNAAGGGLVALNGRVFLGRTWVDFVSDEGGYYHASYLKKYGGGIVDRHATSVTSEDTSGAIANSNVNDVAATIVKGSELGALGLPIPTVAVATGGGVSVIHPNGSVNNIQSSNASYRVNGKIQIDGKFVYFPLDSTSTNARTLQCHPIPYAAVNPTLSEDLVADKYATASTSGIAAMPRYLGNNTLQLAKFNSGFAVGTTAGLSVFKDNEGNRADAMVSHHTSGYCTGYMLGDIRFAGLAGEGGDGRQADRSVKTNNLTAVPNTAAIHESSVATDAELKAYSNFSASNYLAKSHHSSLDLGSSGTVMAWVKVVAPSVGTYQSIITYNSTTLGQGYQLLLDESERAYFYVYGASGTYSSGVSSALTSGVWHQIVGVNTGSRLQVYVNGKLANDSANVTGSMDNGSANLNIGIYPNQSSFPFLGSISLARVSATVATPTQVADIYRAEAPLFRAGAKCLLQSDHPSLPNTVLDLAHDKSTDLLSVSQYATISGNGISRFRGLEMVDTFQGDDYGWDVNSTNLVATSGGVSAYGRTSGTGGVIVDIPPVDVRGDINTADTKLPDDGKFHFSGVTTDATPTVVANIPISENERYKVSLVASGETWPPQAGHWIDVTMEETFFRKVGDNVVARGEASKLTNESLASMDIDLVTTTGGSDSPASVTAAANHIMVKVTGVASTRVAWNATVEVQRVASEKQYER